MVKAVSYSKMKKDFAETTIRDCQIVLPFHLNTASFTSYSFDICPPHTVRGQWRMSYIREWRRLQKAVCICRHSRTLRSKTSITSLCQTLGARVPVVHRASGTTPSQNCVIASHWSSAQHARSSVRWTYPRVTTVMSLSESTATRPKMVSSSRAYSSRYKNLSSVTSRERHTSRSHDLSICCSYCLVG